MEKAKTKYAVRGKAQSGNALIEFSICATVLFLMFCGIVDFARLFSVGDKAVGAAAAGTDYGSLSPAHWSDYTGMQTAAANAANNPTGFTATASQFCTCTIGGSLVACDPSSCAQGYALTYVQTQVNIPWSSILPYPGMPSVTSFGATSTVRVQ